MLHPPDTLMKRTDIAVSPSRYVSLKLHLQGGSQKGEFFSWNYPSCECAHTYEDACVAWTYVCVCPCAHHCFGLYIIPFLENCQCSTSRLHHSPCKKIKTYYLQRCVIPRFRHMMSWIFFTWDLSYIVYRTSDVSRRIVRLARRLTSKMSASFHLPSPCSPFV